MKKIINKLELKIISILQWLVAKIVHRRFLRCWENTTFREDDSTVPDGVLTEKETDNGHVETAYHRKDKTAD